MLEVTSAWKIAYPEAHVGLLILREVSNPPSNPELEDKKRILEAHLKQIYSDPVAIQNSPILQAYEAYYRPFKKTYHLRLQLESIINKGKPIPRVAALVEAMFMTEMEYLLLTAGHDLDAVKLPLSLDIARGNEDYRILRGEQQLLKEGDMLIRDQEGVISSIIYGPDQRTQIHSGTTNALFTVYAPKGIDEQMITRHLQKLEQNVQLFSPDAHREILKIYNGL